MNHIPDTGKMVSDTPRTDDVDAKCDELGVMDAISHAICHGEQLERELNAANERMRRLESWIADLEQVAAHSGKSDKREWFGPEIGWLHPGHVAYMGEAKP